MESNTNVTLTFRNYKTGKVIKTIKRHNIVSKQLVLTLIRAIDGQFSSGDSDVINENRRALLDDYIPHYFAMGSNIASSGDVGITTVPTFNDSRLLTEFTNWPRMRISQRNLIEYKPTNHYAKLIIKHYVPHDFYTYMTIGEAGLFISESGNSCVARVNFDRFYKDELTVIDVMWEITIVSAETSLEINNAIDRSSIYMAMEDTLNKLTEVSGIQLSVLMKGITDYAERDEKKITQDIIDQDTEDINKLSKKLIKGKITTQNYKDRYKSEYEVYKQEDFVLGNLNVVTSGVTEIDGSYEIQVSDDGTLKYVLRFVKPGYLKYTITNIDLSSSREVTIQDINLTAGDVNSDDIVDSNDLTELNNHINEEVTAENQKYDINEDGLIDSNDRDLLQNNMNKTSTTEDWKSQ